MGLAVQLQELYNIKQEIWDALCYLREETITKELVRFPEYTYPRYVIRPGWYWSPLKKYYTQVGQETDDEGVTYLIYKCVFDTDSEYLVYDVATEAQYIAEETNVEITEDEAPEEEPDLYTNLYTNNFETINASYSTYKPVHTIQIRGYDTFSIHVRCQDITMTMTAYCDSETTSYKRTCSKTSWTTFTWDNLNKDEHTIYMYGNTLNKTADKHYWWYWRLPDGYDKNAQEDEENT